MLITMTKKDSQKTAKMDLNGEKVTKPHYSLTPADVSLIEQLRRRYQTFALKENSDGPADISKSEIVRAGIYALTHLSDSQIYKVVESLQKLKKGRPRKK